MRSVDEVLCFQTSAEADREVRLYLPVVLSIKAKVSLPSTHSRVCDVSLRELIGNPALIRRDVLAHVCRGADCGDARSAIGWAISLAGIGAGIQQVLISARA